MDMTSFSTSSSSRKVGPDVVNVSVFDFLLLHVRGDWRRKLTLDAFIAVDGGGHQPENQQQEGDVRHRSRIDFRYFSTCHERLEPVLEDGLAFHRRMETMAISPRM